MISRPGSFASINAVNKSDSFTCAPSANESPRTSTRYVPSVRSFGYATPRLPKRFATTTLFSPHSFVNSFS